MGAVWKRYSGDFNAMTDDEVQEEVDEAQSIIDENTEWIEAVASWVAAGRPRDIPKEEKSE